MSGIATAAVVAAGVGYVASEQASSRAADSASSELEFAQNQYNDWKDIYGPVEENLAGYYNNLTPEAYTAQGIQYAEEEYARVDKQMQANFAQRGIDSSGVAAAQGTEIQFANARYRAQIMSDAPSKVAQQQLDFLSVGQGNNPASSYQNTLSNQAARDAQASAVADQQFAGAAGTAVSQGIQLIGSDSSKPTAVSETGLAGSPYIDNTVGVA